MANFWIFNDPSSATKYLQNQPFQFYVNIGPIIVKNNNRNVEKFLGNQVINLKFAWNFDGIQPLKVQKRTRPSFINVINLMLLLVAG